MMDRFLPSLKRRRGVVAFGGFALVVIGVAVGLAMGGVGQTSPQPAAAAPAAAESSTREPARSPLPDVTGKTVKDATSTLNQAGYSNLGLGYNSLDGKPSGYDQCLTAIDTASECATLRVSRMTPSAGGDVDVLQQIGLEVEHIIPPGGDDHFTDGTLVVGKDIQPGTYRTDGGRDGYGCIWDRLRDTTGDPDSVITGNASKGPMTVTIAPSDGAFRADSCMTWTKQ